MTSRPRTVEEKVGEWERAFKAVAEALTADQLREKMNDVIATPLPGTEDDIVVYTAKMNTSMALARLVSANDRAAGTIAALLVAQGIKPAAIDYGDDT